MKMHLFYGEIQRRAKLLNNVMRTRDELKYTSTDLCKTAHLTRLMEINLFFHHNITSSTPALVVESLHSSTSMRIMQIF